MNTEQKNAQEKIKSLAVTYADGTWSFDGDEEFSIYSVPNKNAEALRRDLQEVINGYHIEVEKSDFYKGCKDFYFRLKPVMA